MKPHRPTEWDEVGDYLFSYTCKKCGTSWYVDRNNPIDRGSTCYKCRTFESTCNSRVSLIGGD